jgi:hypothetical protein
MIYHFDVLTAEPMNRLTLFIATLCSINCYAQQTTAHKKIQFKIVEYFDGKVLKEKLAPVDTVDLTQNKVDLYFLKRHFNIPNNLPEQFVNSKYKSETIVDSVTYKEDKDFKTNQEKTFKYDSLSRVINYTNSSCYRCNYLPYEYKVAYNRRGQVETLVSAADVGEKYKIYYDRSGNIKQLDRLVFDKLAMQIIMR